MMRDSCSISDELHGESREGLSCCLLPTRYYDGDMLSGTVLCLLQSFRLLMVSSECTSRTDG